MRLRGLVAGIAALALIGAAAPAVQPGGSAETRLTAVEIEVTGLPVPLGDVSILDVGSFASTDVDRARNPIGSPFAIVTATPLMLGGERHGTVTARSDADSPRTVAGLSQSIGPLAVSVSPTTLRAAADAEGALASVEALAAQLALLDGLIGSMLSSDGVVSGVTSTVATASQGLEMSGLRIALGDLLDVESLPIDVVISLVGQLLGGDVPVAAVLELLGELDTLLSGLDQDLASLGALTPVLEETLGLVVELDELLGVFDGLVALLASGATLDTVIAGGTIGSVLQDTLDAIADLLGDFGVVAAADVSTMSIGGLIGALLDTIETVLGAPALADLEALSAQLGGLLEELDAVLEDLVEEASGLAGGLALDLGALEGLLDLLVASVGELLAHLPGLLDGLAGADLVDVGRLTAGITASARADGGDATLGCAAEHVRVVGIDLGAASCAPPLTQLSAALDTLRSVLGSLPVVAGAVPAITLDVFSGAHERVELVDGYWRASAGVNLLELDLPSLELGALTDGLLDGIASGDISALVSDLLGVLTDQLGVVGGAGVPVLGDLVAELDALVDHVTGSVPIVDDVEEALAAILAGLPASDALAGARTPGVRIVVDPTSTAEFRAAPGSGPGDDSTPDGPLPSTGGGVALLGFAVMAGALGLLRRRS